MRFFLRIALSRNYNLLTYVLRQNCTIYHSVTLHAILITCPIIVQCTLHLSINYCDRHTWLSLLLSMLIIALNSQLNGCFFFCMLSWAVLFRTVSVCILAFIFSWNFFPTCLFSAGAATGHWRNIVSFHCYLSIFLNYKKFTGNGRLWKTLWK